MDIIIPILVMLLFYLVPELLKKRKKPEEYEYPEIPEPMAQGKPANIPEPPRGLPMERLDIAEPSTISRGTMPAVSMPPPVDVPQGLSNNDSGAWQGKLTPALLANGIVFATILGQPRCREPFHRSRQFR
ncbi:MAG TPA: hypothetical protein VN611_01285 [Patescibacteria group bacterium]|nr:hypothetical protein [Patescibacteria group bacterium]